MIKAEHLTRSYGDVVAVDDVSFEIGPREIVGLLGHNGAGKTTIMKMVTGYLEPTQGLVTVDGLNVAEDRILVQQKIGYLPENCPLYHDMTAIGYLDFVASLRNMSDQKKFERIRYAIAKTKLESVAKKTVNTLSRGYRQRLGVAQAILAEPKILILDEPTNGLDPSQILEMRSLIKELSETAPVIVSTHILQEVQAICDRVLIIKSGKMAMDSRMSDLQTVQRISVCTDANSDQMHKALEKHPELKLGSHKVEGDKNVYVLVAQSALDGVAPGLVRTLVGDGFDIHWLKPETRDLETIFGEISSRGTSNAA